MKKRKESGKSKTSRAKVKKYKMKTNEFLFIYNLYKFEILHKRPINDIKIYYFIKPDWIKNFKEFFNCEDIYEILDKNIKNDYFLNLIKADKIPDEFNKIKCESDKIPNELYDFEYNGEYIINLNEDGTKISYYPFKVFILEESMNNLFDINGKSFKFEKGRQGIMVKNTFYGIIDDRILEVFTYNEKTGLYEPLCLFCFNYKYDLYSNLNNFYKYKEINEYLEDMDYPQKPYPKYIRDSNQNVLGKIVYLVGNDAPNNLDNFINENKKDIKIKDILMKQLIKEKREERMRETKRILKEVKLKEKERKEELKREREEIKERIKRNKQKLKEEMELKEFEETIRSKKYKIKLKKEKEKEKFEDDIRNKELEERLEKERKEKEEMEEIEKEKERINKERILKEREDMIREEKEKLENEIKEKERKQAMKIKREKELYEKIQEETKKLDEEKSRREAEKRAREEAERLRIESLIMETEEKERKIKEEKELKKKLKNKQREEEKKRIREGFERLNQKKEEEKRQEELNKIRIKKEIKEKRYWEKIKEESKKLEKEKIKREQEIILRNSIIKETQNLEKEQNLTKEEKKIKNEEKRIREEQELNKALKKEIKKDETKEKEMKNDESKENIQDKKSINTNKSKVIKKEKIRIKVKEREKEIINDHLKTTEDDIGSEVDKRFRKIASEPEKSEEETENYIDDGKEPKIGLKNVEAMCYMNATIQCFSKTMNLTKFFLAPENKSRIFMNNSLLKDESNLELCTSYYEVIQNLWNKKSKKNFFVPLNFKEKLRKMNSLFQGYNSGEPKDLISFILFKLHQELNTVKKTKESDKDKNKLHSKYNVYDRFNVLNDFLTEVKIKNNSIISETFYGTIENISECLICKEQNKNKGLTRKFKYEFNTIRFFIFPLEEIRQFRNNKFLKINANIMTPKMMTDIINNNRVFIMDCFEFYQNPIIVDEKSKIYCKVCQKNTMSNFRTKIYYPPYVMILILDRGENIKNKIGIDFLPTIDITQFVDKEFTVENKFEYELYGVITFIGENTKAGKYIAFCKSHDDTKKWFCYNDDNVTEIVDFISQVHNYGLPCVLFYERINFVV